MNKIDRFLPDMLAYASSHPEDTRYMWCKNCDAILGIVTGRGLPANGIDENDTCCAHCGDNATRLTDANTLLRRWGAE